MLPPMTDTLLTPADVAKELGLNKRTIYAMLRSGELPHVDLGYRTKRIRRSALDEYIKQHEGEACN